MAVAHADQIVQLQADLEPKELPPDWMYQVPWVLADHLKDVVEKRKNPRTDDDTDWDDDRTYEMTDPDTFANWL